MKDSLVTTCVHCGEISRSRENVDGKTPSPGDISVCWSCGGAAKYGDQLELVHLTDDEMEEVKQNVEFRELQHARLESTSPAELLALWRQGKYGTKE